MLTDPTQRLAQFQIYRSVSSHRASRLFYFSHSAVSDSLLRPDTAHSALLPLPELSPEPPYENSSGKSIPTLLAVRRTLSSSSMPIPGLYLSNNVAYILCALTYCKNCSACSIGVLDSEAIVLRMRACRGDLDFSDSGREGSSRRKARYIDRSFVGVAIV
jgi:hypothetical protein